MTLVDHRDVVTWTSAPATALDHSAIADFLATTQGLGGRKFASDSRDVAEHVGGAYPSGVTVVRDAAGIIRGYALLREPHGDEVGADFVFGPDVPERVVSSVVEATVDRFHAETDGSAFLRSTVGTDQQPAIDALTRQGAWREAEFVRTRKPLDREDVVALGSASLPAVAVLSWAEVVDRGLGESVRRVQFDTFAEHFGNMSKSREAFHRHVHSRSFTPDFSLAAVDTATGEVVGYVLGSTFTAGAAPAAERSAHTDYIGVRADHRKRGIAELLLRKIWLAALRRGLTAASLGTDIRNRSNAHLLYERLGYVAVQSQYAYRIDPVQEKP
ncbi:GNAT family N-acetyltransferase [Mycolicibacterium sediminis]|uniref:GNAT family acetyltransferase n=1 Tax=Mycolicibacterium sediminis TaxID=1286180 RepID=A0A7I7QWM7_9MYCO|nr:GNAT family N-acetyltransferase [Mycolicibacterium sediminis]BBY30748.1 GNAT family acetyltransferase [Mycolicibacterium sediminis]